MATTTSETKKKGRKPVATKTAAQTPLEKARAAVGKKLKEDPIVNIDHNTLKTSLPHIPTGSTVLDYLIGGKPNQWGVAPCPGIPRGRVTNLYGHESSGKTTLALTIAANVCRAGGTVLYIDWENEIVPDYAAALGVPIDDPKHFILAQPTTLEEGFKMMYGYAHFGVDLIIVDSVGAGVAEEDASKDLKDQGDLGRVGLNAAKWSKYLPKIKSVMTKTNTTLLGIAQLRDAINTMGYGEKYTVQGGNAWKFYSSLRIRLKRIKQEKKKIHNALTHTVEETVFGAVICAELPKCKIAASQGQKQNFYLRHGSGIDNVRSLIDIAANHGIVKKGGAGWYTWVGPNGETIKIQGADKLGEEIVKQEKYETLYAQTLPYLTAIVETKEDSAEDENDIDFSEIDDI